MNLAPLNKHFAAERGQAVPLESLNDRRLLAALLTVRDPGPIPKEASEALDALL